MFYFKDMQRRFDFLVADIVRRNGRLLPAVKGVAPCTPRAPIAQLIKSMISGRTRDAVSLAAFERLSARYGTVGQLASATPEAVERIIVDVTFAPDKARHLIETVRLIKHHHGGFHLDALGEMPVPRALAALERLPGVGRKVAASTLNASTLAMPVMIVDTHVLRVLRRLGLVHAGADYRAANEAITEAMTDLWDGPDFLLFHVMLKRLGQQICRHDVPTCALCPLADDCPTAGRANGIDNARR